HPVGRLAHFLHGRQQQADEDPKHCQHHQQVEDGEAGANAAFHGLSFPNEICVYWLSATGFSSAILRMSWVMRIEQNFGPHIEQNFADLNTSCGSVSSCIARAVSGSSDSSNCRFQSNSKRAFDRASSRSRTPLRPRATSAAWPA